MFYFNFHPEPWRNDPIWRAYFSNGLVQPPTRNILKIPIWDPSVLQFLFGNFLQLWGYGFPEISLGYLPTLCGLPGYPTPIVELHGVTWVARPFLNGRTYPWVFLVWNNPPINWVISPGPSNWIWGPPCRVGKIIQVLFALEPPVSDFQMMNCKALESKIRFLEILGRRCFAWGIWGCWVLFWGSGKAVDFLVIL